MFGYFSMRIEPVRTIHPSLARLTPTSRPIHFAKSKRRTTRHSRLCELIEGQMDEKLGREKKASIQQAIHGRPIVSWALIFLDYIDLKARLMAVESKEASAHLIGLLILLGTVLVLAVSSVLMYGAFLLYVVARVFHLTWGWSALICGAILTISSLIAFFYCECGCASRYFK